MELSALLAEVDAVFSLVGMPSSIDLVPESPHYIESDEIRRDLDELRYSPIDEKVIRTIHRYLPVLSAKTTRWILPHYLKFCLSEVGQQFSRNETASLIYALSPDLEFKNDTLHRISLLTREQISCLIHFLELCAGDSYWINSEPERIKAGIEFLEYANTVGHTCSARSEG